MADNNKSLIIAAVCTLLVVVVLTSTLLVMQLSQAPVSSAIDGSSSDVVHISSEVSSKTSSEVSSKVSSEVSSETVSSKPVTSKPQNTSSTVDKNHPYYNIITAVSKLNSKRHGYGFGLETDSKNRPLLALEQQKKYGKFGMTAITDHSDTIYLTLDEGYEAGYTSRILDVLKEKNCKATFFVTMSYVKECPGLVRRMINEGHIVGNHSVSHPVMPEVSVERMITEIMDLHYYILEHFGYEMKLFRPPTGAYSEVSLEVARSLGYRTVEWSFAYEDWNEDKQPNKKEAYNFITSKTHGGAVYLLHAVSKTNAEIIGDVIDYWRAEGYTVAALPNVAPDKDIPKPEKEETESDISSDINSNSSCDINSDTSSDVSSDINSEEGSSHSSDTSSVENPDVSSAETEQTAASTQTEKENV